MICDNVSFNLA